MFVEKIYSLVDVATPLDLTLASSLIDVDLMKPSRAATVVKEALVEMIAALASRNFIVQMVMSDGEGAIGKLKNQLQMLVIDVDVTGAGGCGLTEALAGTGIRTAKGKGEAAVERC